MRPFILQQLWYPRRFRLHEDLLIHRRRGLEDGASAHGPVFIWPALKILS